MTAPVVPSLLNRFLILARVEGLSFLLLLFIAMPLKYLASIPGPVKYLGWAHGVLFIAYMAVLLLVIFRYKWNLKKSALGFLASVVPFGPFFLDKYLKETSGNLK